MTFDIDPISAASPDMSDLEMKALRDSIASIGQQVPILVLRGKVIDGRKRLATCEALGVEPKVLAVDDAASPTALAEALNLRRTHYTSSQRAAFAERLATQTKTDAARRRVADPTTPNLVLYPPTQAEAAQQMGVSTSAIIKARHVRRTAAPEVMEAVESGKLTLHAAEQISKQVPHESQARVVEEVIRESNGKRNTPSKIINAAAPGKRRPPRKDVTEVRERSLRSIHAICSALDQFMDEPIAPESDVVGWQEWIRDINRTLTKFTRRLEKAHERSA